MIAPKRFPHSDIFVVVTSAQALSPFKPMPSVSGMWQDTLQQRPVVEAGQSVAVVGNRVGPLMVQTDASHRPVAAFSAPLVGWYVQFNGSSNLVPDGRTTT